MKTTKHLGAAGLTAVLGAMGLVGDTGCAREPTAVILAVTTDMSVVQDLDEVGLDALQAVVDELQRKEKGA